ncbi:MAG: 3-deoxy-manno-octulosonate-8-phosphatase KdsC [Gammaproteobacteria bacterium]|nr:3-deoxy-manno-octulosonate-8-phosphatase KdsC [Gammaproteobacteria bacterium]
MTCCGPGWFEPMSSDIRARAAQIRLLILDVDGVLTDGRLFMGDDGAEYKTFHTRDGHGMKQLMRSGVEIAIISGRCSSAVERRMAELGVTRLAQGQSDKQQSFENLLNELDLAPNEVAYMGDDLPDLAIMRQVGLATAVADAHELTRLGAHWVASINGGFGAVRELCDLIIAAQGNDPTG